MPKTYAVAIALVATLPLLAAGVAPPARADATVFTVPPFHVGDRAVYADGAGGFLNHSVGAPVLVMDKAGRMVEAVPVGTGPSQTEYFSARTLILEMKRSGCASGVPGPDGTCPTPVRSFEWAQGAPAVMGVTFLQGRAFRIGDAWDVEGDCACTWRNVSIEAPRAQSPPGTAYVARIRGDYSPNAFIGRIHMAADSPFPLLAEWTMPPGTATLVGVTRGADPIPVPSPPELASYPTLLPVLPFEDGRPVEGTPNVGWPSWSDARNLTGPDPADATPGARFISLEVPTGGQIVDAFSGTGRLAVANFQSRYAIPGSADRLTTYGYVSAGAGAVQGPAVPTPFAGASDAPASTVGACVERSIPIWDGVRYALGLPYLHRFRGYSVDYGGGASHPSCTQGSLSVYGATYAPPGSLFGVIETVAFDADAGHLRYAKTFETT